MRILATVVMPALLLASTPALLSAQERPQTREGFTIAFGVGAGSAGYGCDGCSDDRRNGVTGFLRVGGTVRPNLIVSGQTRGYTRAEDGVTQRFSFLLAGAQWYPQTATGWYVEGGLGFGSTSAKEDATGDEITSAGLAGSIGTGYDIRVGKNFSLTPFLNYMSTFGAESKGNGVSLNENLNGNVFQMGLGFTWH
jgi:hypothetical protein